MTKNTNTQCPKCKGNKWYQYDDVHSKPCEVCCKHDKGYWELKEHYGKSNGMYCCLAGCGHKLTPKEYKKLGNRVPDKKVVQDTHTDWEGRFDVLDRKYGLIDCGGQDDMGNDELQLKTSIVKDFIRKELADARREVISKVEKMINLKYPPNVFTEYTNDPNVMTMSRGVAESTHIRRLSPSEVGHIKFLDDLLATLRKEDANV